MHIVKFTESSKQYTIECINPEWASYRFIVYWEEEDDFKLVGMSDRELVKVLEARGWSQEQVWGTRSNPKSGSAPLFSFVAVIIQMLSV